jgi:hypothetical protein
VCGARIGGWNQGSVELEHTDFVRWSSAILGAGADQRAMERVFWSKYFYKHIERVSNDIFSENLKL